MNLKSVRNHNSIADISESLLGFYNDKLSEEMKGECIFIKSGIRTGLDTKFKYLVQKLTLESDHLIVMLETNGGSITVAERLVNIMRAKFKKVSFVIPNFALSAGTVLAMSGDNIYMDYFSVLGPIDPQIQTPSGGIPGYGVISKYHELINEINTAGPNENVTAQITLLLKYFDQAELYSIDQARKYGIKLVTEWLAKYKFKDWKVSSEERKKQAEIIASKLGDPEVWFLHGRGITKNQLESDLKLKIDDFGSKSKLNEKITQYHNLAISYFENFGIKNFIHSKLGILEV